MMLGSRRVSAGRDRAQEIGTCDYGKAELARAEQAWKAAQRRQRKLRVSRRLRTLVISEALVVVLAMLAQISILPFLVVVLFVGLPSLLSLGKADKPDDVLVSWRTWQQSRVELEKTLSLSLDQQWTIAWDRRVLGIDRPITMLAGPTGLIGIWVKEPGWESISRDQIADLLSVAAFPMAVSAYVIAPSDLKDKTEQFARQLACRTVSCSAGDIRAARTFIEQQTMPEVLDLDSLG